MFTTFRIGLPGFLKLNTTTWFYAIVTEIKHRHQQQPGPRNSSKPVAPRIPRNPALDLTNYSITCHRLRAAPRLTSASVVSTFGSA
ncbi:hypothetical protein RRG08_049605 [Elysia crispata]|uniref:Uncharacterized protein n=1 Tax=Elysia crispata TaxID=231223 RepID=A0AAE1E5E9_9GAST|nr:hypothetical protein RRG08_049605 [Elysia crispata]